MATHKEDLKAYFLTGNRPNASEFAELIDSSLNIADDKATDADIDAGTNNEKYVTVAGAKKVARKYIKVNGVSADSVTGNIILSATEVPLTFGTGLTRTLNAISVNNSQNISKINNFTANGYLKTKSSDGTLEVSGTIQGSDITGDITPSSGAIGYSAGNGGVVTQTTSKSTPVNLNKLAGDITLANSAMAADSMVSFTLNNSKIAATDIIHLQHQATGTLGNYTLSGRTAAGSAIISIKNNTAGALSEAVVIRFIVIKSVIS